MDVEGKSPPLASGGRSPHVADSSSADTGSSLADPPRSGPLERTQSLLARGALPSSSRGWPSGARRTFGRTHSGLLDTREAGAIRDAAERVLSGQTLSSVVEQWNRQGLATPAGGPWRINSLSGLLLQDRLTAPPPILDARTHARLLELHASRRKGRRRPTRRYLLTGILRCSLCAAGLRGMSRDQQRDLYVCPGPPHGGCSGTAITADHADAAIRDLVLARLHSETVAVPGLDKATRDAMVDELETQNRRLLELGQMWASGELSRPEWLSLRRHIEANQKVVVDELGRQDSLMSLREMALHVGDVTMAWASLSLTEQRQILGTALEHVVVLPASRPRTIFRPERLRPVWRS